MAKISVIIHKISPPGIALRAAHGPAPSALAAIANCAVRVVGIDGVDIRDRDSGASVTCVEPLAKFVF